MIRGTLHLADGSEGSSGDAEWRGLVYAIKCAVDAGERDIILLGDSAAVIAQASGKARARGPAECQARLAELTGALDRLRFRHIKRNQNLAGIALDRDYERGFAR